MTAAVPDILYGKGSFRRDNGNFSELKLINMFAEATPTTEEGVAILSRNGMDELTSIGSGPINVQFQRPGLFDGAVFTLSNNALYRGATLLGTITGTGPVRIASSNAEVVITRGDSAYSYNGTNLQAVVFPDGANVTAVAFIGGLFIYLRADTHNWYWSAVNDGRSVSGADFASAESSPDPLRDVVAIGDNLYLLGAETVEPWFITGEALLPFTRMSQRIFRKGVIATGCALEMDNALHFIGSDFIVYRMADVPQRISHHAMEERVGESSAWSAFSFNYQGHAFFCVRLDQGTWLSDPSIPGQWPEWKTWGQDNWIAQCAVTVDGVPRFGSAIDGKIFQFGGWTDDGAALERRFTAGFTIKGGSVPIDMLEVECNAGSPTDVVDPRLEMRSSRDGGDRFGDWRSATLGGQGNYRRRPRYRRCGYFDAPGALFDFRCTDECGLRVSAVLVNESSGGRSRGS